MRTNGYSVKSFFKIKNGRIAVDVFERYSWCSFDGHFHHLGSIKLMPNWNNNNWDYLREHPSGDFDDEVGDGCTTFQQILDGIQDCLDAIGKYTCKYDEYRCTYEPTRSNPLIDHLDFPKY